MERICCVHSDAALPGMEAIGVPQSPKSEECAPAHFLEAQEKAEMRNVLGRTRTMRWRSGMCSGGLVLKDTLGARCLLTLNPRHGLL